MTERTPLLPSHAPVNRFTDVLPYDDGFAEYRCFDVSSPEYYQDENGTLRPIILEEVAQTESTVGRILLRDKNIVSAGIRTDGTPTKYLGLRPDENQKLGTEQLEFSIEGIEFDGQDVPVDLTKNTQVNPCTIDLGNCVVQNSRVSTRQMVKVDRPIEDFKVSYKIHLKGLKVQNPKVSGTQVLREAFIDPDVSAHGIVTTAEWYNVVFARMAESRFSISFGQQVGKSVTKGTEDDICETLPEGYFVDQTQVGACTSYMNDGKIHILIKDAPMKRGINRIFCEALSILAGKPVTTEGYGYICDGKLIGGYVGGPGWIGAAIDTKDLTGEIPKVYKDPNRWWDISKVGYLDTTYEQFVQVVQDHIITRVKKANSLSVTGEYYQPDEFGRYIITDMDGSVKFTIRQPILIDAEFTPLTATVLHTLCDNPDGTLEYVKYPTSETITSGVLRNTSYIDAYTYYGELTGAGTISNTMLGDSSWGVARSTGGYVVDSATNISCKSTYAGTKYQIVRAFTRHDTSALSAATITAVSFKAKTHTNQGDSAVTTGSTVYCYAGTQSSSLTTSDYNSFGSTIFGTVASGTTANVWKTITFNAAGRSHINKTGDTKLCLRDYHDAVNSPPTSTPKPVSIFYGPDGTANQLYLSVTATFPSYNVTFSAGTGGTLSGTTSQTVSYGGNSTAVTAVPNSGYAFVNWTGYATTTSNPLTATSVYQNRSYTANFELSTQYRYLDLAAHIMAGESFDGAAHVLNGVSRDIANHLLVGGSIDGASHILNQVSQDFAAQVFDRYNSLLSAAAHILAAAQMSGSVHLLVDGSKSFDSHILISGAMDSAAHLLRATTGLSGAHILESQSIPGASHILRVDANQIASHILTEVDSDFALHLLNQITRDFAYHIPLWLQLISNSKIFSNIYPNAVGIVSTISKQFLVNPPNVLQLERVAEALAAGFESQPVTFQNTGLILPTAIGPGKSIPFTFGCVTPFPN